KRNTVAILRCLGARAPQALAVYVLQATVLGAIGALVGGAGGLVVQFYLPRLLRDFLPVSMPLALAWPAGLPGSPLGGGLFPLFPILPVRRVTPLLALHAVYAARQPDGRDLWRWGVLLLLVGSICAFALSHTERWTYGVGFCAALGAAFGLLTAVAKLLMWLVR